MGDGILLAYADPREGERVAAAGLGRVVVTGVGKVAAAARLAAALQEPAGVVLLFGVCGAYPDRHAEVGPALEVLDLCVVGESVLGDEGAITEGGFLGLERLGLGSEGPWAADPVRSRAVAARVGGPVVRAATVSTCSGTEGASAAVAARTHAHVETMESAACAFVCAELGVPLVEVRCVSNRTGRREDAGFALGEAAARVQDAVLAVLREGVLG